MKLRIICHPSTYQVKCVTSILFFLQQTEVEHNYIAHLLRIYNANAGSFEVCLILFDCIICLESSISQITTHCLLSAKMIIPSKTIFYHVCMKIISGEQNDICTCPRISITFPYLVSFVSLLSLLIKNDTNHFFKKLDAANRRLPSGKLTRGV